MSNKNNNKSKYNNDQSNDIIEIKDFAIVGVSETTESQMINRMRYKNRPRTTMKIKKALELMK